MSVLVIISVDRLVLQHVLKISCYVHYFFLQAIIMEVLQFRTGNSEKLMQVNDTLRNTASSMMMHCLHG